MRIVLFTPVSAQSAIARVSTLVCDALRKDGHDVAIVSIEEIRQPTSEQRAGFGAVTHWTDEDAVHELLRDADAIYYQVGNSYRFHAGSIVWLGRVGGIVCLHDHFLGHLFVEWASRGNEAEADRIAHEWYSVSLEWLFGVVRAGGLFEELWPAVTFLEWLTSKSTGIVTHSDNRLAAILEGSSGPLAIVPLPYDSRVATSPATSRPATGSTTILTFGEVNANKQADAVLRAIAADDAVRRSTQYRVVGSIDSTMRASLTELARDLGVELVLTGRVDGDELAREILGAGVIACLRQPSLEAASASTIESMLAAKAVIVVDTGFYASLPDDAVLKVSAQSLERGVTELLLRLQHEPRLATDYGARAQRYARETFVADRYARQLVEMAAKVELDRGTREAMRPTIEAFAGWGIAADSPLLAESNAIAEFFASSQTSRPR